MSRSQIKVSLSLETRNSLEKKAKARGVKIGAVIEELVLWDDRFESGRLIHEGMEILKSQSGLDEPTGLGGLLVFEDQAEEERVRAATAAQHHEDVAAMPPFENRLERLPELRDPTAKDVPEWVKHVAAMVRTEGGPGKQQAADLKAWMTGTNLTPGWWDLMVLERAVPPEPEHTPPPVDPTAAVTEEPPAAFVPPPVVRQYTDKDAPVWIGQLGEAVADGSATDEETKVLGRWMRGEDVTPPKGWPK